MAAPCVILQVALRWQQGENEVIKYLISENWENWKESGVRDVDWIGLSWCRTKDDDREENYRIFRFGKLEGKPINIAKFFCLRSSFLRLPCALSKVISKAVEWTRGAMRTNLKDLCNYLRSCFTTFLIGMLISSARFMHQTLTETLNSNKIENFLRNLRN